MCLSFSVLLCKEENNKIAALGIELSEARAAQIKISADLAEARRQLDIAENNYKSCISNGDATKTKMQLTIDDLRNNCARFQSELAASQKQMLDIMARYDGGMSLLSEPTKLLLTEYDSRYAEADITYNGRYLGNKDRRFSLDVKSFCLQGQNDYKIVSRVAGANAYVKDIMMEKSVDFHRACDIAVARVLNVFGCNYSYDSTTWGTSEFWMFASETEAYGQGDCDDMAVWRYVGCRIAGIPAEMLRVAAGTTFNDKGHATNFYFASDLKWHHLNSTTNFGASVDVRQQPLSKQEGDMLNLRDIWFSFNEKHSWHELVTDSQKDAMRSQGAKAILKHFKIIPKGRRW